ALEIMLALFAQVVGFDEDGPGLGREVVAKMAGVSQRPRVLAVAFGAGALDDGAGYFDDLEFLQTSLRLRRELTDRFNFVAEEREPVRRLRIRREDVENAPAPAEFTRKLDRFGPLEATID